jgi:hypothetical protein
MADLGLQWSQRSGQLVQEILTATATRPGQFNGQVRLLDLRIITKS